MRVFQLLQVAIVSIALPALCQNTTLLQEQLGLGGVKTIFPNDTGYDAATRPYNLRFTWRPIAITYPINVDQIATVVKAGAAHELRVVARSGGHSYIANSLGGKNGSLVVDLSQMKNITVDPVTKNALIETGNRLGDIALRLNEEGRGLPHGRCAYVGIGGHSGFGGWGFASRMWGMTLDNILSATVVLANGSIVEVSNDVNSELFWGIRGSSASFGIVSSILFRTHTVPPSGTYFLYTWYMDIGNATSAFSAFQSFALSSSLPIEFGGEIGVLKGPSYGTVEFAFLGSYFGPDDSYNATVAPFLDLLPVPGNATVSQGTWIETLAAGAVGNLNTSMAPDMNDTFYAKSLMTPMEEPLSEAAMGALMTYLAQEGFESDDFWHVEIELYGGRNSAVNDVLLDDTAFAHRNTLFTFQPYASSPNLLPPFPEESFGFVDGMVSSVTDNMPSDWNFGAYPNYLDGRLRNWKQLYYGTHYDRLRVLKSSIDPEDLFQFPTSIEEEYLQ